ncbi:hypothetical protein AVEN_53495-1 [Araneus ventricosus]|uniref:Uncharacterized protein n=1 Tax=Araneus ventricosus TaxID=182803 RepID=A0A4Y2AC83_ARAVE|nr:hypothetical protein AVEN_53495-1 [Araneus ventricosus]
MKAPKRTYGCFVPPSPPTLPKGNFRFMVRAPSPPHPDFSSLPAMRILSPQRSPTHTFKADLSPTSKDHISLLWLNEIEKPTMLEFQTLPLLTPIITGI